MDSVCEPNTCFEENHQFNCLARDTDWVKQNTSPAESQGVEASQLENMEFFKFNFDTLEEIDGIIENLIKIEKEEYEDYVFDLDSEKGTQKDIVGITVIKIDENIQPSEKLLPSETDSRFDNVMEFTQTNFDAESEILYHDSGPQHTFAGNMRSS